MIKLELTREEALAILSFLHTREEVKNSIADKLLIELYPDKYTPEHKERIRSNE